MAFSYKEFIYDIVHILSKNRETKGVNQILIKT